MAIKLLFLFIGFFIFLIAAMTPLRTNDNLTDVRDT